MQNLIENLRWRGMIHNEAGLVPGTEAYLNAHQTTGYIGFDPTSDSLHIGSLATIMLLVQLQQAGHKPIALVGGATGMVGDPSGKDKERQLLGLDAIDYNVSCIRKQLAHFLDFEVKSNPAELLNNHDWLGKMGFLEFLRDVGKHITINYMMAKDSVEKRISGDSGISYTEFAYQLLQGYDFLWLYENRGVRLQMGGADQWGNITTGTHLIHKIKGNDVPVFGLTCPLITREDGSKFGKTAEGDSVWLSPERTSPYKFYQYWINISDDDAARYIKVFTLKERREIEELLSNHSADPGQRQLQRALAQDITRRLHGEDALASAEAQTRFFFAQRLSREELLAIPANAWKDIAANASDGKAMPRARFEGANLLDLLFELGIAESKSDARRAVEKDQAISINGEKCSDIARSFSGEDALHGQYLLLQRGKKNKYIVVLH